MKRFFSLSLLLLSFFSFGVPTAMAAPPKSLGRFGYWTAYQMYEGPDPVCYMTLTAKPPVKKGGKTKRGDVVLMISHRPAESATDVISYAAGAKFKSSSDVTLKISGKEYNLFTQGDTAWARDAAGDHAVTAALRSATSMTVLGMAANGESIADTVNLKGFADAYYVTGKACGLAVEKPKVEKKSTEKPAAKKKAPAKTTAKTTTKATSSTKQ